MTLSSVPDPTRDIGGFLKLAPDCPTRAGAARAALRRASDDRATDSSIPIPTGCRPSAPCACSSPVVAAAATERHRGWPDCAGERRRRIRSPVVPVCVASFVSCRTSHPSRQVERSGGNFRWQGGERSVTAFQEPSAEKAVKAMSTPSPASVRSVPSPGRRNSHRSGANRASCTR